jgi:hypothetical protein
MKKLLLVTLASAVVALSLVVGAGARDGNGASFAVGSAQSDLFVGTDHFAFSAHNGVLSTPFPVYPAECAAKGHLNYTTTAGIDISADVIGLTITPGATGGGFAFIIGQVTKASGLPIGPGAFVWFDVSDSDMHPDGTGDTFFFEGFSPVTPPPCFDGLPGRPVTSGNVVVKAGSLLP